VPISIFAWPGAVAIGVSLGLLGSGGSILTVPVLVYLMGQDEKVAIAGIPGMAGTYLGALSAAYVSGIVQLSLFAVVMLLASYMMLRPMELDETSHAPREPWKIAIDGLLVGVITGLVGVGGGFLIVPALALLGGLSMHRAVATSLVIIALKSFSGFYKYLDVLDKQDLELDWQALMLVTGLGIAGSFAGARIAHRVPQHKLKQGFAVFLIVMGIYILYRSLPEALGFAA